MCAVSVVKSCLFRLGLRVLLLLLLAHGLRCYLVVDDPNIYDGTDSIDREAQMGRKMWPEERRKSNDDEQRGAEKLPGMTDAAATFVRA